MLAATSFAILSCGDAYRRAIDGADRFLSDIDGTLSVRLVSYDGSRMAGTVPFEKSQAVMDNGSKWSVDITRSKVEGCSDAQDFDLTFTLTDGNAPSSGAAVELVFDDWDTENYLFAPASVYDGNRFDIYKVDYPPYIYDESMHTPDMPVTVTDVPHMKKDGTDGKIEMLTSNCSSPLVGFYDRCRKRGFFLQTVQDTVLGNSSFIIRESPSERKLSIMMGAPGVREYQYYMCGYGSSEDVPADFVQGDRISMRFRLYDFAAEDLNAFFDRFLTERKSLRGNTLVNRVPFSNIAPQIMDHHLRTKWYESEYSSYLCCIPGSDIPFWNLQLGWNGVPVYTLSQFFDRDMVDDEQIRRLVLTFNTIRKMQTETGFFYAILLRDRFVGDNFKEMYDKNKIAMMRRTAITIYFSLQLFDLLKLRGQDAVVDPSWEKMIRDASDALVRTWRRYGEFGQHVNCTTGDLVTFNSSNCVLAIAALAYASQYFKDEEYLAVAAEAADYYYKRDVCRGYLGGAPAEILQAPDSEAAAEMTESFVALYEITGENRWIEMARASASIFSTWVVPYDFRFPDGSAMKRVNAHSAGSVWANVQNAHSAPGIYIMSGDFLLKLYRATGDRRYIDLLRDIVHNVVQYVNTKDNPVILNGDPGAVSERVNLSDWETKAEVGGSIAEGDSNIAWEDVTLYSIMQNPGIYVQTDTGEVIVFDHVNVTLRRVDGHLALEIENPTPYDACVSVMAETSARARTSPLGWFAYDTWPRAAVPAGKTVTYTVPSK